jgi:hypothetical protein
MLARQTVYNKRWLAKPGNREKQRGYVRKCKKLKRLRLKRGARVSH